MKMTVGELLAIKIEKLMSPISGEVKLISEDCSILKILIESEHFKGLGVSERLDIVLRLIGDGDYKTINQIKEFDISFIVATPEEERTCRV